MVAYPRRLKGTKKRRIDVCGGWVVRYHTVFSGGETRPYLYGGYCLGGIFHSIEKNKSIRTQHHTDNTPYIFYGLIILTPLLFLFQFEWGLERFAYPSNIFNILFLGFGASALCFATWNFAARTLGVVKTSVYIYLVPVITVVTSVIVLSERITWMSALGTLLTLGGLFISGKKIKNTSKEHTV
jgi:drug/metabolite transporter (DMT)-like permease